MNINVLLRRAVLPAMAIVLGMSLAQARAASETALRVPPTMEQLQQALDRVSPGLPRIREFLGCVPALGQPVTVRLCTLLAEGRDLVDSLPFQLTDGRWEVMLDGRGIPLTIEGACAPPLDIVPAALRILPGDAMRQVSGEVDNGEGIFTAQRGVLRDKKGPYRLMCRYDVVAGSGKKYLLIVYVWHDGAHYVVDSDIELWPDD